MIERTAEVAIPGGSLFVRWWGPEQPTETLVLVHGGPGISHRYLEALARLATDRRRVVAYDQRGTGRTRFRSDVVADYGLDAQAADLSTVLDRTALGPVDVLGHSWGGIIAMDYAARFPDRARSIILVGTAAPTAAGLAVSEAAMEARIAELQTAGLISAELPEDPGENLRAIMPMYLFDPALEIPQKELDAIELNQEAYERTWEAAIPTLDLTDDLRGYRRHVLIAHGRADPLGIAAAEEARDAFVNAHVRLEILEGTGHFPWLERAPGFFDLVSDFLAER